MLVLIAGLPGSGKSFFGQRFAEAIGAVYLNSDNVRTEMSARGRYSDDDKLAVYKQLAASASDALKSGRDVIVDATFYRQSLRELVTKPALSLGASVYIIEVRADEAIVRKRLSVPRALSEADFRVYEMIRDNFEKIPVPHLVLTSTDTNIEDMLREAMQYIKA